MQLFDSADRESIEWGLKRVFNYSVDRINRAIAAQVSVLRAQSPKIRLCSCSLYWILKYRICHRVRAHLSEPISMRAATEHTYVSDLKQFQELVFKVRSAEWSQDGKRITTADDMSTRV